MATPPNGDIQVYKAADGGVRFEVRLERETVWLTQRQLAELFDTSTDNVGLHQKNIFAGSELEGMATAEDFSVVQVEGKREIQRRIKHYNLDAILSVGYRVNSRRGVTFRQWAAKTLRCCASLARSPGSRSTKATQRWHSYVSSTRLYTYSRSLPWK